MSCHLWLAVGSYGAAASTSLKDNLDQPLISLARSRVVANTGRVETSMGSREGACLQKFTPRV